ncbi:UDP-xylose synthase [Brevipalpus obovatus]|uniref:UDP-xylose synthase n=1 Tax=Brevipalpus obovatus TaxID=246614 RepID=UPI003D9DC36E
MAYRTDDEYFVMRSKSRVLIVIVLASVLCLLLVILFYHKLDIYQRSSDVFPSYSALKNSGPINYSVNIEQLQEERKHLIDRISHLEARLSILEQDVIKNSPKTKNLSYFDRKRILVTGGAGFVGSHLVDSLMREGHEVTVVDNFFTGRKKNLRHWISHPNFELIHHDIVNPLYIEVDQIYHLASPASPPQYMINPVKTIKTNSLGTINVLGLAKRIHARVLIASTSEVYGNPEQHPQKEDYWGNVNPIGPRSCYDEGKRIAEALSYAYARQEGVEVRVARIFNTYGPRMNIDDGRMVSNFISQALQNQSITVYGEGKQTRSLQYIDDLIDGLIKLMKSNYSEPVNIGNPQEYSIHYFATLIKKLVGAPSDIIFTDKVEDDPQRRKPDITRAKTHLNWSPKVSLRDGLLKTIDYFRDEFLKLEKTSNNNDNNQI